MSVSDGDFRRPPQLWEQKLAALVSTSNVGAIAGGATSEVAAEIPPGEGGTGTEEPIPLPPPGRFIKPSTPSLLGMVQGINVIWDGLNSASELWPSDTSWVEVHLSTAGTGFTPGTATMKGRLVRPGAFPIGGLASGTAYYVRLMGADPAGNYTDPSDAATGYTGLTTASDYGTATIGTASVSFNARTIGGVTNTVGSAAPSSPIQGDIWLDNSAGTTVVHKYYNGSTWVTQAWGSASIAAGQITALQMAAGAITAGAIAAGAVTTDKLTAGTISGFRINGGTISGGYISGGTISGGFISGGTISGGVITSTTVNGYQAAGTYLTPSDVASGGSTTIDGGRITTGTISAARLNLTGYLTATDVGSSGSTTIDGGRITTGTISGRTFTTTSGTAGSGRITLADASQTYGADAINFFNGGTRKGSIYYDSTYGVSVDGKLNVWSTSSFQGNVLCSAALNVSTDLTVGGDVGGYTAHLGTKTVGTVDYDALRVSSTGDVFSYGVGKATAGGAANVNVASTGNQQLRIETSTVKIKTDVRPFSDGILGVPEDKLGAPSDIDHAAVLTLVPVDFQSLCSDEGRFVGFIAEDVAAKLPRAAQYDENGDPRSIDTRAITACLLQVVKDQQATIADLTARIETLEA